MPKLVQLQKRYNKKKQRIFRATTKILKISNNLNYLFLMWVCVQKKKYLISLFGIDDTSLLGPLGKRDIERWKIKFANNFCFVKIIIELKKKFIQIENINFSKYIIYTHNIMAHLYSSVNINLN